MAAIGAPEEITPLYNELNFGQTARAPAPPARAARAACSSAAPGARTRRRAHRGVAQEGDVRACFEVEFHEDIEDPLFAFIFRNEVRHTIFVASSDVHGAAGRFEPAHARSSASSFENWLAPSRYTLTASVGRRGDPDFEVEAADDLRADRAGGRTTGGVVDMPSELEVERR